MNLQSLEEQGFTIYPRSIRSVGGATPFVARRGTMKLIGVAGDTIALIAVVFGPIKLPSGDAVTLHELTWENYEKLRTLLPIGPVPCNRPASFGTGDRLGMVTAAHLDALGTSHFFPVIAQQSPRELQKTRRTFKDVLLDAVMGVLEVGYTGSFGADADHIKDEQHLIEAVRAGYSMYTLDLSGLLSDSSDQPDMSDLSRAIVEKHAGLRIGDYAASEQELVRSAMVYQTAMEQVVRFHGGIASQVPAFDLEISIDEGGRDTTLEDHLFVAEYLHGSGIDFTSIAPKFPGKFRKGIDYIGDVRALADSMTMHAGLARMIGGYKLSLHSGSDKWSVYQTFTNITEGMFHVKTSGTSWLVAVTWIAAWDQPLFREMYRIALDNLSESVKAYDTDISIDDFPAELPPDAASLLREPHVRQLFHISYGVLLGQRGDAIRATLTEHEETHYRAVSEHIRRHLELLFW